MDIKVLFMDHRVQIVKMAQRQHHHPIYLIVTGAAVEIIILVITIYRRQFHIRLKIIKNNNTKQASASKPPIWIFHVGAEIILQPLHI